MEVAVEVERMSEANRYTTKLLVERGAAGGTVVELTREVAAS